MQQLLQGIVLKRTLPNLLSHLRANSKNLFQYFKQVPRDLANEKRTDGDVSIHDQVQYFLLLSYCAIMLFFIPCSPELNSRHVANTDIKFLFGILFLDCTRRFLKQYLQVLIPYLSICNCYLK